MIHHQDNWLTIHGGDARDILPTLPAESVDCIVTSPPYWGLRDYGTPGQLGLEATPEEYVANLVGVFRELRRVLKRSGTCWLNLGDSYSLNQRAGAPKTGSYAPERPGWSDTLHHCSIAPGLKPKDLVGIPWRAAFALQADGWWLRSDIIWAKPNPMPESVTDRPTKAHEYLFLVTKAERYYFDQEAVREPSLPSTIERMRNGWNGNEERGYVNGKQNHLSTYMGTEAGMDRALAGRNIRSVWTIATRPYPGAHFAVFPPELPERCIKAGSSERGVCPTCGAPWVRVVERSTATPQRIGGWKATGEEHRNDIDRKGGFYPGAPTTTDWKSSCTHTRLVNFDSSGHTLTEPLGPVPATVLDPFAGSGTVGLVANRLSRRAILIDLNPAYLRQQMARNAQVPAGL